MMTTITKMLIMIVMVMRCDVSILIDHHIVDVDDDGDDDDVHDDILLIMMMKTMVTA